MTLELWGSGQQKEQDGPRLLGTHSDPGEEVLKGVTGGLRKASVLRWHLDGS